MTFVGININKEELVTVKVDLYNKFCLANISNLNLKEKIKEILISAEYDISICDEKEIDLLYKAKYDDDSGARALGIYYVNGKERPKIYICLDRIEKAAKKYNVDVDELLQQVLLHEVGHHIFQFTNSKLRKETRKSISEGLANYFVYLIGDEKDRNLLDKITGFQNKDYSYYKNFVEWAEKDEKGLFDNLLLLIIREQGLFINYFLKQLIDNIDDERPNETLLDLLIYIEIYNFELFYEMILTDIEKGNTKLLIKLLFIRNNLDNNSDEENEIFNNINILIDNILKEHNTRNDSISCREIKNLKKDQENLLRFILKQIDVKLDNNHLVDEILLKLLNYFINNYPSLLFETVMDGIYNQNYDILKNIINININSNNYFDIVSIKQINNITSENLSAITDIIYTEKDKFNDTEIKYLSSIIPKDKIIAFYFWKIKIIMSKIELRKKTLKVTNMKDLFEYISRESEENFAELKRELTKDSDEICIEKLCNLYIKCRELENKMDKK